MNVAEINIKTKDGVAPCHYFVPFETAPPVIVYMDVFGVRPSLIGMSERLASRGYRACFCRTFIIVRVRGNRLIHRRGSRMMPKSSEFSC